MPLRNFVAIGFKIKEISFFLCSLSLLPAAAVQPVGAYVPKNPLLRLTNPFTHLCIMNLHMPLQVGSVIHAMMSEILMPQYLFPYCPEIIHATRFVFMFLG
jgi:hypothetical protein